MTQPHKARIAVIGTGWWSTYTHIPGLLANPDARLVALCDVDAWRLDAAARHYGVEDTYTDYRRMLAEVELDGAVVATYHATHYEVAKACLERGLHVMIEKPMTLRAMEARELLDIAARKGKQVIVGYPFHYTENTRRAREIIASGDMGRIEFVSCLFASSTLEFLRGTPDAYRSTTPASTLEGGDAFPVLHPGDVYSDPSRSGGGQGHLQITHSAGTMFYVTGLRAERVSAFMQRFELPVDLVDAISVRFEGGAVGALGSTGNTAPGDKGRLELAVHCQRGRLVLEQHYGTLWVRCHNGREESYGPLKETYPRFDTANNLVGVILGQAPNRSPGEVGLRVVELLDAAYRSAGADGRPVSVGELY